MLTVIIPTRRVLDDFYILYTFCIKEIFNMLDKVTKLFPFWEKGEKTVFIEFIA